VKNITFGSVAMLADIDREEVACPVNLDRLKKFYPYSELSSCYDTSHPLLFFKKNYSLLSTQNYVGPDPLSKITPFEKKMLTIFKPHKGM